MMSIIEQDQGNILCHSRLLNSGKSIGLVSGYSKKANGYTWYKLRMNGKYYYIVSNHVKRV